MPSKDHRYWTIGAPGLSPERPLRTLSDVEKGAYSPYPPIVEARPTWATGAFAIAVFGGALGALLLLFRKSAATYFFMASLLGVILTMIHTLSVGIEFGVGEILGIILMPLVVGALLIWYSKWAESKSWIS